MKRLRAVAALFLAQAMLMTLALSDKLFPVEWTPDL